MRGNYSREETIQGRKLFAEIRYVHFGSWKNRVTQNLYLQDFANDSTNVVTAVVVIVLCGLGYIGLSEQKKL